MNPVRLHILHPPEPEALGHLRRLLDPLVQLSTGPRDGREADILVSGRPEAADLEPAPGILLIPYAGLPDRTRSLLLERPGIRAHNIHHNAASAAEMAIALLLASSKMLLPADQALRKGDWSLRLQPGSYWMLDGRRALVIGYGAIGVRIARACAALGMRVSAVRLDPRKPAPPGADEIHPVTALHGLLPLSDALMIAVPLTPGTRGLIGAAELGSLSPDAVLVNVARGEVVDEKALYTSLAEGRIRAAGLDVWYRYPVSEPWRPPGEETAGKPAPVPPSACPFHELDNVVMSPHRGGSLGLADMEMRRMDAIASAANAAAAGGQVPHPLDPVAGY